MRTPYGANNKRLERILSNLGYRAFLWNLATRDWLLKKNSTLILDTVRKDLEKSSFVYNKKSLIILQHDTIKATSDVQDQLIKYILSKNFKIVTLNECIGESNLDVTFQPISLVNLKTINGAENDINDEQFKLASSILTVYQIYCFVSIIIFLIIVFFKKRYILYLILRIKSNLKLLMFF